MTSVAFLFFIFFSIPLKGVVFYRGVGNGNRRAASGKLSTGHFSNPPFRFPKRERL